MGKEELGVSPVEEYCHDLADEADESADGSSMESSDTYKNCPT